MPQRDAEGLCFPVGARPDADLLLDLRVAGLSANAQDRSGLTTERPPSFKYPTQDGYQMFLDVGKQL